MILVYKYNNSNIYNMLSLLVISHIIITITIYYFVKLCTYIIIIIIIYLLTGLETQYNNTILINTYG